MIADHHKLFYLIMIGTLLAVGKCNEEGSSAEAVTTEEDKSAEMLPEPRALFSPRVDYNEWLPVGRGDPLKNDPTYDYSPPTLDRVRYWDEKTGNKEKTEILLLGVPSKRQSQKKETSKFSNSIRRSYYAHLPTRLMPPPVQTISPSKSTSTEGYHNSYSNYNGYKSSYGWGNSKPHYDTHLEESVNIVSLTKPERPISTKLPSNVELHYSPGHRKPWLHELLHKEISKPTVVTMEPSQNIYESHQPVSRPVISSYSTPVYTTTTASPEPTYFQPTIPPVAMTTDSLFSHYNQPMQPVQGPLYLIIEGHSKVKTYGSNDNETDLHKPKIVPVPVKKDAVIKHVVSKNAIEKVVETKPSSSGKQNKTLSQASKEESSPVQSLLSLLDKSLGNFFLNSVETTNNETTPIPDQTTTEEPRERRQIFDYDQLPESILKDLVEDDEQITVEPKSFSSTIADDDTFTTTDTT